MAEFLVQFSKEFFKKKKKKKKEKEMEDFFLFKFSGIFSLVEHYISEVMANKFTLKVNYSGIKSLGMWIQKKMVAIF